MSQNTEGNQKTFIADGAIPQFARVIFEADRRVVLAGITQIGDGIAESPAFAAGDEIAVKVWNSSGTFQMIAAKAIDAADILYTAASGKVSDTAASTSFKIAKAYGDASGDESVIECALLHAPGVAAET